MEQNEGLPPAVVVHGLAMAQAVLAVAAGRPLTLLSGVGAGCYAGVGWWMALAAAARAAAPGGAVADVLDCGDAPGRALEALRAGQGIIVLRADPMVWADIAGRAGALGRVLLAAPPPALDMAQRGAARRLSAWLGGG